MTEIGIVTTRKSLTIDIWVYPQNRWIIIYIKNTEEWNNNTNNIPWNEINEMNKNIIWRIKFPRNTLLTISKIFYNWCDCKRTQVIKNYLGQFQIFVKQIHCHRKISFQQYWINFKESDETQFFKKATKKNKPPSISLSVIFSLPSIKFISNIKFIIFTYIINILATPALGVRRVHSAFSVRTEHFEGHCVCFVSLFFLIVRLNKLTRHVWIYQGTWH